MKKCLHILILLILSLCINFSFVWAQTETEPELEIADVEEVVEEHLVPVIVEQFDLHPTATATAIATATKIPTATATRVPPTATATRVPPTATATRVPPTATATQVPPTATATATDVPTATATQVPPTATATQVPPTATATQVPPTATATATDVPTATATQVPPTVTATATDVPTATATQVSPTATATATDVPTDAAAAVSDEDPVEDDENADVLTGQTYRINPFNDPQVIKLPKATTSYWFFVPEGTEIEAASLSLYLETSATLLEDYSTVTIEVNGIAVETLNLIEFVDNKEEVWNVEIPVEWLKTDGTLNQLSILTAQRSILGECADIDNPANWLVISEESSLFLTILSEGHSHLDNLYAYLFNRAELGNKISTGFSMAGSDKNAEFSAALSIASAIGGSFPYKDIENMTVWDGTEAADSIFKINADSSTDPSLPSLKAGEGYLGLSMGDGVVLNVAGGQASGLTNAVRTFSDNSLLSQFSSDNTIIRHTPDHKTSTLSIREDGRYTLEDFHYSDVDLAGAFHQQTTFTIHQPDGVMGGPGSYFEVHFRHSDALLSDTSLLTVQFDGVPASSIQLSRMNTESGSLRVTIPAEVLAKGTFEIGIDVYNYLGKIDCSKDWYDVAWTVIDSDSVVYFEPSETTVLPSLGRFPAVFGELTIVSIPESSSNVVKEAMLMFAARNSQNTQSVPEYIASNDISYLEKSGANIMIAGSRDHISIPDEIAEILYIAPKGDDYVVKAGVNVMPEALDDKIIIQAVRSPYDYKRVVYVIMWPDADYEKELLDFALDKTASYQMSGQLALFGPDGAVSIDASAEAESAIPFSAELLLNRVVRKTGIPKVGLAVILGLIIVIIILIIRALRKKNRFETARSKMEETNAEKSDQPAENSNPDDDFDDEE